MESQLSDMRCITPYMVKMDNEQFVPVPCGKCPPCRSRRASGWSFRLMQQEKISQSSSFITLTYDTTNVPISVKGFMSLNKRDVQLFFKRLRKAHNDDTKIKYYVCGEYGGQTNRPHYHAIIFNVRLPLVQPAWDKGQVYYGSVTGASIGYVLKYMCKENSTCGKYEWDDRIPEFSLMSKGMGVNYLSSAVKKWHKSDMENRMYCPIEDGKKIAMPRYYKDKMYTAEEREIVSYAAFKKAQLEVHPRLSDEQILHYYKTRFNEQQRGRNKI